MKNPISKLINFDIKNKKNIEFKNTKNININKIKKNKESWVNKTKKIDSTINFIGSSIAELVQT
jgi:hypothetical protein